MLGVGTGEALNEVAVGAVPQSGWPEFKERFARLRESVRLMRALWTEESVTFEGDYYRTEDARIFDRPDAAGAGLRRRGRSARRPVCRPVR